jgi:hypothetical protein
MFQNGTGIIKKSICKQVRTHLYLQSSKNGLYRPAGKNRCRQNNSMEGILIFSEEHDHLSYMAAPGNMVETVQSALLKLNISQEIILTEYFTAPTAQVPPPDFKPVAQLKVFKIKLKYEGKQVRTSE